MLWTLIIQLGSACWALLLEGGDLGRMGVHALVLSANNTGILAPVVLEAALGKATSQMQPTCSSTCQRAGQRRSHLRLPDTHRQASQMAHPS